MAVLKLTSFGNSTVVVISPEMLERLKVREGDELVTIEVAGGYLLTTHELETDRQLKVAARNYGRVSRNAASVGKMKGLQWSFFSLRFSMTLISFNVNGERTSMKESRDPSLRSGFQNK